MVNEPVVHITHHFFLQVQRLFQYNTGTNDDTIRVGTIDSPSPLCGKLPLQGKSGRKVMDQWWAFSWRVMWKSLGLTNYHTMCVSPFFPLVLSAAPLTWTKMTYLTGRRSRQSRCRWVRGDRSRQRGNPHAQVAATPSSSGAAAQVETPTKN